MTRKPTLDRERSETLRPADFDATLRLPAAAPPVAFPIETRVPQVREQVPAVGQRATRPDARLHGLGQTRFIDDLAFPGMLHAKIKRAGIAAARIRAIATREAEAMPGGMAVLTEQIALEALERIRVDYEPLPAVFDPFEALREDAPRVHAPESNVYASKVVRKGDIEQGFAASDHVFEGRFRTQMVEHAPLEPHASIALWDANGRLTVHSTLGRITLGRADIARVLGLPVNRVRVVATIVGGNFGGKNEITQEPVLALLSKKTGRPVKGVYTRTEEFIATTTRHPIVMDYRTGVTRDGRILARKVRLLLDGGAYCSWSETTLGKACILSAGPYRIDHLHAEALAVYTNKTMTGAMRGFGAPQVCFAYESHMDDIAAALAIDPLEIRLRNAFDEGSASPTGQVLHSVVIKESLALAAERFGWKEPRS